MAETPDVVQVLEDGLHHVMKSWTVGSELDFPGVEERFDNEVKHPGRFASAADKKAYKDRKNEFDKTFHPLLNVQTPGRLTPYKLSKFQKTLKLAVDIGERSSVCAVGGIYLGRVISNGTLGTRLKKLPQKRKQLRYLPEVQGAVLFLATVIDPERVFRQVFTKVGVNPQDPYGERTVWIDKPNITPHLGSLESIITSFNDQQSNDDEGKKAVIDKFEDAIALAYVAAGIIKL